MGCPLGVRRPSTYQGFAQGHSSWATPLRTAKLAKTAATNGSIRTRGGLSDRAAPTLPFATMPRS
eukprot:scaffold7615_cov286-Pinguiococcus_pyrenoidosus.AAC.1